MVNNCSVRSRSYAQMLINQGLVKVDGKIAKASTNVLDDNLVEVLSHEEYVSRGAYKLIGALEKFNLQLKDKIVLDLGASTGGFTQVCLKNGAKKVYAVDIGAKELNNTLMLDKRVINVPNTDVRSLKRDDYPDVNFIVGDLSFISLKLILPMIKSQFTNTECMLLFKPQFECGLAIAKKCKGIIRDEKIRVKILNQFLDFCSDFGMPVKEYAVSPITGGDGNVEYLLHFV